MNNINKITIVANKDKAMPKYSYGIYDNKKCLGGTYCETKKEIIDLILKEDI